MYLKFLEPPDLQENHDFLCVPEVYEYLADGVAPPMSVAEKWVEAAECDWSEFGGGLWALVSDDAELVGVVRLSRSDPRRELELTYLLHPGQWGRGLATQMAHTAMSACFIRGRVETIWAGADEPNVASIAVMQRLGMTFRGYADYPAGRGVEYEIKVLDFYHGRHERLKVVG